MFLLSSRQNVNQNAKTKCILLETPVFFFFITENFLWDFWRSIFDVVERLCLWNYVMKEKEISSKMSFFETFFGLQYINSSKVSNPLFSFGHLTYRQMTRVIDPLMFLFSSSLYPIAKNTYDWFYTTEKTQTWTKYVTGESFRYTV